VLAAELVAASALEVVGCCWKQGGQLVMLLLLRLPHLLLAISHCGQTAVRVSWQQQEEQHQGHRPSPVPLHQRTLMAWTAAAAAVVLGETRDLAAVAAEGTAVLHPNRHPLHTAAVVVAVLGVAAAAAVVAVGPEHQTTNCAAAAAAAVAEPPVAAVEAPAVPASARTGLPQHPEGHHSLLLLLLLVTAAVRVGRWASCLQHCCLHRLLQRLLVLVVVEEEEGVLLHAACAVWPWGCLLQRGHRARRHPRPPQGLGPARATPCHQDQQQTAAEAEGETGRQRGKGTLVV